MGRSIFGSKTKVGNNISVLPSKYEIEDVLVKLQGDFTDSERTEYLKSFFSPALDFHMLKNSLLIFAMRCWLHEISLNRKSDARLIELYEFYQCFHLSADMGIYDIQYDFKTVSFNAENKIVVAFLDKLRNGYGVPAIRRKVQEELSAVEIEKSERKFEATAHVFLAVVQANVQEGWNEYNAKVDALLNEKSNKKNIKRCRSSTTNKSW